MRDGPILILGAGAAGLAAAAELVANGHRVTLLEARERFGGRIHTEASPAGVPIELGAEFVHGESRHVLRWLRAAGDVAIDAAQERWWLQAGRLVPAAHRYDELKRRLGRLKPPSPDVPLAEFLERHRRSLPQPVRELARTLVQGFDAADPGEVSTREVLSEWSGPVAADASTFRPSRGYGALIEALRRALPPERATLHLGTVVRTVRWRKGHVVVEAERHGSSLVFEASRVIVTLPLGVLQAKEGTVGHVRFDPPLDTRKQQALAGLASGPVVKVVLQFSEPFWAAREHGRYRNAAFFFVPGAVFPTVWTALPARAPVLVAWSGGPHAARLGRAGEPDVLDRVFDSLHSLFGRAGLARRLEHVSWHDWRHDPYALGAYSSVRAGGAQARRALAAPAAGTLYFAGEACDTRGEAATVGGAIASGERAAHTVLRVAGRRER